MSLIHIVVEGNVYSCARKYLNDTTFLQSLPKILSKAPPEKTFDALYHAISKRWRAQNDIPYPFGDRRECLIDSSWIVDLDNDLVTLRKKERKHYQIRLSQVVQNTSVDDMEPTTPLFSPQVTTDVIFEKRSIWNPDITLTSHQSAFTVKLLNDLMYQWRHVLRASYNDTTFRQFSCAIIRIVTLNFQVEEVSGGRFGTGRVVWLTDLPLWSPFPDRIIEFDHISVALCQYLTHAEGLIRADLLKRQRRLGTVNGFPSTDCVRRKYMVISVREIWLYEGCACTSHNFISTKPESLLNGTDGPSERALAYLHMIAPPFSQNSSSQLHALPLELQDMILHSVSSGLIESARIGCAMSLGSPFRWKNYHGAINRQDVYVTRTSVMPTESQIWFDGYPSGLVYK